MNGRKAKALRKAVYGDLSQKGEREYGFFRTVKRMIGGLPHKKGEEIRTTVVCKGLRAKYRQLKRSAA